MYLAMFSLQGMDGGDYSAEDHFGKSDTTSRLMTSLHQELMMIPP